jgi:hypothetical protein
MRLRLWTGRMMSLNIAARRISNNGSSSKLSRLNRRPRSRRRNNSSSSKLSRLNRRPRSRRPNNSRKDSENSCTSFLRIFLLPFLRAPVHMFPFSFRLKQTK